LTSRWTYNRIFYVVFLLPVFELFFYLYFLDFLYSSLNLCYRHFCFPLRHNLSIGFESVQLFAIQSLNFKKSNHKINLHLIEHFEFIPVNYCLSKNLVITMFVHLFEKYFLQNCHCWLCYRSIFQIMIFWNGLVQYFHWYLNSKN